MSFSSDDAIQIRKVMEFVKAGLTAKYGMRKEALLGRSLEATNSLATYLDNLKFDAKPKQVWVLYQNIEVCPDKCYDEHWVVEINKETARLYIDLTLEQFQYAFDIKLPRIWTGEKLPTFMLRYKPGKATLEKCGWTDLQKTGYYTNNFEYKLNR